tara:strand:- start:7258 stop:8463 length:1206 start_codon:yes stop_codon:yes gene_type:complete
LKLIRKSTTISFGIFVVLSLVFPMAFDLLYVKVALIGISLCGWTLSTIIETETVSYKWVPILCLTCYVLFVLILAIVSSSSSPVGLAKVIQVEIFWPVIFFILLTYLRVTDRLVDLWFTTSLSLIVCHVLGMYIALIFFGLESYFQFMEATSFGAKAGANISADSFQAGFTTPGLMSLPFLIPYYIFSRKFSLRKSPMEFLLLLLVVLTAMISLRNFVIITTVLTLLFWLLWWSSFQSVRRITYSALLVLGFSTLVMIFIPIELLYFYAENLAGSNDSARTTQISVLLAEFEKHPFWGIGLGMPSGEFIRSEVSPWSYELTYHAALGQRGAIGFLGMIFTLVAIFIAQLLRVKFRKKDFFFGYALALAFLLLANATNPYFARFDGIFLLLLGLFARRSTIS